MNFIDAVKICFTKFANFEGRARRSEYWWFFLFNLIVSIILTVLVPSLSTIYSLATLIPSIAVAVRRMHDLGKSGWYCLIPIYNIILAATNGESGSNQYGADPKGSGLDDDIEAIGQN